MAEIITVSDLPTALRSGEMVGAMVAGANAKASRVAPCLVNAETPPTEDQLAEARLVLIGAVKRWSEAGSGALQSQSAGIFAQTVDTRQRAGFNLWPSEIQELQAICSTGSVGREAFSIETAPAHVAANHLPWCDVSFGDTCSCGANISRGGEPIWELG